MHPVANGNLDWVRFHPHRTRIAPALVLSVQFAGYATLNRLNSVGRNASSIEGRHLAADAVNIQRRDELKALARNRAMLAEAEGRVSANCADGDGKLCKGAKATVAVYTDAIKGNLATLKDIGPEVAEDQTARKVGEVVALMGGDAARTIALVDTFRPFILSLFAELTAIVALGFALGHGGAPQRHAKPSFQTTTPTKMTVIEPVATPIGKPTLRVVASREHVALPTPSTGKFASWLDTLPVGGEVSGTQRELAIRAGVALSALQRGLDRASRAGTVRVVVDGRETRVVKVA